MNIKLSYIQSYAGVGSRTLISNFLPQYEMEGWKSTISVHPLLWSKFTRAEVPWLTPIGTEGFEPAVACVSDRCFIQIKLCAFDIRMGLDFAYQLSSDCEKIVYHQFTVCWILHTRRRHPFPDNS
jgi:hypothetical protein